MAYTVVWQIAEPFASLVGSGIVPRQAGNGRIHHIRCHRHSSSSALAAATATLEHLQKGISGTTLLTAACAADTPMGGGTRATGDIAASAAAAIVRVAAAEAPDSAHRVVSKDANWPSDGSDRQTAPAGYDSWRQRLWRPAQPWHPAAAAPAAAHVRHGCFRRRPSQWCITAAAERGDSVAGGCHHRGTRWPGHAGCAVADVAGRMCCHPPRSKRQVLALLHTDILTHHRHCQQTHIRKLCENDAIMFD